jgi:hypothetical protein
MDINLTPQIDTMTISIISVSNDLEYGTFTIILKDKNGIIFSINLFPTENEDEDYFISIVEEEDDNDSHPIEEVALDLEFEEEGQELPNGDYVFSTLSFSVEDMFVKASSIRYISSTN